MKIEGNIFKNDYVTFNEKDGVTGITISAYEFDLFLECTAECAEALAKDLLEDVESHRQKNL